MFMREIFHRLVLVLAAAFAATVPSAVAAQDTQSPETRAFLVTPLSFVKDLDLDFGQIIATDTAGTVTMDSTGAITTTGGIFVRPGTQQPARFAGYGAFNQIVRINVDAASHTLTRQGGTETMIMDQMLIGSSPPIVLSTTPLRFRIANPAGFFFFTMAGRLQVGADQEPGVYEGEFTIALEYE